MKELEIAYRLRGEKQVQLLLMGAVRSEDEVTCSVYCATTDLRKGTKLRTKSGHILRVNEAIKATFTSVGTLKLTIVGKGKVLK